MNGVIRAGALAALVLVVGGAFALYLLFGRPADGNDSGPLVFASSEQCLDCHPGVAEEWRESHHAFAFENPEVRKLSNDFRNEECLACHAPKPVLDFRPGERVTSRSSDRASGVDCLACHALPASIAPEGGVATSNPAPVESAPCRPRTVERMADVQHCATCHNQHGTVDQWRDAPVIFEGQVIRGENCLHCHMPEVFREGGRRGRDHAFRASHDLEALRKAARIEAAWGDGGPRAEVVNHGAGHNFPTDERSRAADVQLRWRTAEGGWGAWVQLYRFRDPYRDEDDLTNTQLPSGETWSRELEPPDGAVAGEARLLYKTNPFMPDEEAKVVGRVSFSRPGEE